MLSLQVEKLCKKLGEFSLKEISFTLDKGDYLVLLGPSGSGKTSLLKAICGLFEVDSGSVFLSGLDITSYSPQKRDIGYVPQAATLFPNMNVKENITFGLRYSSATKQEGVERLAHLAEALSIGDLLGRDIFDLSGGEAKRVALARSLILQPKLLLLDEPLGMLDHNSRQNLVEMLKEVVSDLGIATIHVTHDREEAWNIGGICAVMDGGVIRQIGSIDTVFRSPADLFIAEFTGAKNVFPAEFSTDSVLSVAELGWAKLIIPKRIDFLRGFVSIRPESIVICKNEKSAEIQAIVSEKSDRGSYVEVTFKVSSSVRLFAHFPVPIAREMQIGERYYLKTDRLPHAIPDERDM